MAETPEEPSSAARPAHPSDRPVEPLSDDELGGWLLVVAQFLALASLAACAVAAWPWPIATWILTVAGFGIAASAAPALGASLRAHPEPNRRGLRTSGPYRYVRHPMYLGMLLAGAGVAFGARPVAWVFFGFLTLVLLTKIGTEEKALARAYPEFEEYRSRTKALIPFVL